MPRLLVNLLAMFIPNKASRREFRIKMLPTHSITINDNGVGNKVVAYGHCGNKHINIYGDNNLVQIDTKKGFSCTINVGTPDSPASNCVIKVGIDTTSTDTVSMRVMENGSSIRIGSDCMFSADIFLECSDTHAILDMDGKILNIGESIEVGDHVWVGQCCKILKNSAVPSNSIVGMNSLVTRRFQDKNCIIAGIPANVVKRNVCWDRRRPQQYINDAKLSQPSLGS